MGERDINYWGKGTLTIGGRDINYGVLGTLTTGLGDINYNTSTTGYWGHYNTSTTGYWGQYCGVQYSTYGGQGSLAAEHNVSR